MIRQVSSAIWKSIIASKGTPEQQAAFIQSFDAFRLDWGARKQALSAPYKGNLDNPDYIAAKTALHSELETQMIAWGYYEQLTEAQLDTIDVYDIVTAAKRKPLLVLRIVTAIANYYREQQGKTALTETQVKTRLLS